MNKKDQSRWETELLNYLKGHDQDRETADEGAAPSPESGPIASVAVSTIGSSSSALGVTRPHILPLRPILTEPVTATPPINTWVWTPPPSYTDLISKLYLPENRWVTGDLPYIIIDPAPTFGDPIPAGDFLLWPDPKRNRAFFTLTAPRLVDFSLTVQRANVANTIQTIGGTAVLGVSVYPREDLQTMERYRNEWSDRLAGAGHGVRLWKFEPLLLRRMDGRLNLPSDHARTEPDVTLNAGAGTATFLLELTELGAIAWQSSLEMGHALPGTCEIDANYYAQAENRRVSTEHQILSTSLGSLVTGLGPEVVHTVNPEISVEAQILVAADPSVESVAVNLQPKGGEPGNQVFGPEGGRIVLQLTSHNPSTLEVDWSAQVNYKSARWPVINDSGKLSEGNWVHILKPSSWVRAVELTAMLIDNAGNVVAADDSENVDPNNRVWGDFAYRASYIAGETPLQTTFETSSQQIVQAVFPVPQGEPPGDLKLTAFALRNGRDDMEVRMLRPSETQVVAKIYANSRIELVTNQDPATELSPEAEMLGLLAEMQAAPVPVPESSVPWIWGPETHAASAGPPTFEVDPSPNSFYLVEVAAKAELFDFENHGDEVTSHNFYASDWDTSTLLISGSRYTLPTDTWDRLKGAGRLYYRIWTSDNETEWVNTDVSTPNYLSFDAPFIEIVPSTTVPSTFTLNNSVGRGGRNDPADVQALKQRLVALGYDWLSLDNVVDADLTHVINLMQSIKAGRNELRGDSRVDVPGPTYDWLRAANAPRWQLMPSGSEAEGFFNVERADTRDTHDYGTDWMADTIRGTGVFYRDNYLATHSSAALLTVNDVSLPRGGDTPDHSGHETGMACDLRLPRTDGTAPGSTDRHHPQYDRDAMRAMLAAVRAQPMVTRIFFNDRELIREGLCERLAGHDDHVHFQIEPLLPIVDYAEPLSALFDRAIERFGGRVVNPTGFRMTMEGFQAYLDATDVQHFSAREMLTPHHQNIAARYGYSIFLPPHDWWPRGAALALIADQMREMLGESVEMRNWWRPKPYNSDSTVDGAADSDHITAHGVDLDYRSADSRRRAEEWLKGLYDNETWLQLSLGLGNQTTHVGILSPGRRRDWFYDSYQP